MITNLSIKSKLISLIVGVSLGVLTLAGFIFYWAEEKSQKLNILVDLRVLAEVFARNSVTAIRSGDQRAGNDLLSSLQANNSVIQATIFREDNSIFAHYSSADTSQVTEEEDKSGEVLSVVRPIFADGKKIGTISIDSSLAGISQRMKNFMNIIAFIIAIASAFAAALASKFQGIISKPLVYLARTIQQVIETKNFSLRADYKATDESGELISGFNQMLSEIERREKRLQSAHDELEFHVADRTKKLLLEISERERIEMILRREEGQMRSLISKAPIAMAMLDMQMRYIEYSDRWLNEFNLDRRSLHGLNQNDFYESFPATFKEMCDRALIGEFGHRDQEIVRIRSTDQRFMNITVQPWYRTDGMQGGIIIVTVDVTDLVKAKENAIHVAQLKSQFLANLSHEVRTPLNAIIGFADLARQTPHLENSIKSYVETIESSAQLLLVLINDVLDFSKIESKKMSLEYIDLSLRKIVDQVIDLLSAQAASKGIDLRVESDNTLPDTCKGDLTRLTQVLINLVGNAIKFTERGEVVIAMICSKKDDQSTNVTFKIKDTGIGIASEVQDKIFDAFTQADGSTTRKFGGTGLGLAISSKLVELMGGKIEVESHVGKGSCFSFTIEFKTSEQSMDPPRKSRSYKLADLIDGERDPSSIRILVVEDNLVNQKLITTILMKSGYVVDIAENGVEAIEKVQEQQFSLIFMDIQMPVMGGLEATRRIRALESDRSELPIIALTAHAFPEDREQCLSVGADEYMTKPINRKKLLEVVERYIY